MSLPSFTLQRRVNGSSARQDKVEFTMPLGWFADTPGEVDPILAYPLIDGITEYLGAPPQGMRTEPCAEIAEYSCYFNRPTGRGQLSRKLTVRREAISGLEHDERFQTAPLCSGMLRLNSARSGCEIRVFAEYSANLNPTRFVRYQDWNVLRRNHPRGPVPPLFRTQSISTGDEFSIDGNDNWIPQNPAAIWQHFTSDSKWPERLTEYFSEVEQAMRSEMTRRHELSSLDRTETLRFNSSDEPWSLHTIETYWEFGNESAAELMHMIEHAMRSYSALPYVRVEFADSTPNRMITRRREDRNLVSTDVSVAPGKKIVVYAKTNKRIRFEVRHNVRELRTGSGLPREAQGVAGMITALQTFAGDAAEVLNAFLAHLERQLENPVVPWSPSPTDFIFKVVERCTSREAARVIVGLLMTEGAVSRIEWLNKSIDALKRSGVLERVLNEQGRQSATFVPTPSYQAALRSLREISDPRRLILEQRQRERQR